MFSAVGFSHFSVQCLSSIFLLCVITTEHLMFHPHIPPHCSSCGWSALLEGIYFRGQSAQCSGAAALCWWPFTSEVKTNKSAEKNKLFFGLILPQCRRELIYMCCCFCCVRYCPNTNALFPECTVSPLSRAGRGKLVLNVNLRGWNESSVQDHVRFKSEF